jgi:type II secretory pathway component GspD/PulD (secretin)
MKSRLCTITLLSLAAYTAVLAQTAPPADATSTGTATAVAAASTGTVTTDAPPAEASTTVAAPSTTPAEATAVAQAPEPEVGTAPTSAGSEVLEAIAYDDAKLTEVIQNLARRAGINYLLDPKIGFGQPGPNGAPMPEPTVTVRWEKVTAEQALTALLNNYNLQINLDPKTQIARVTVKDPAAPDPLVTKIIQLKYASPSNILVNIQATLSDKRSKVVPDLRTSQLVVVATDKELVEVNRIIERLDTMTKQVLIEGRLLETAINPSTVKGVDWSGTLANQHMTMGNNAYERADAGAIGAPIENSTRGTPSGMLDAPQLLMSLTKGSFFNPATAFMNADGVAAVLSFLNNYAETRVISSPRTVTLDNETATIEVGTLFPIVNVTAGTQVAAGGSSVSYSNLTVRLDVTPRISANDYVNLRVKPTVFRLGDVVRSSVNGIVSAVNSFQKREIDTTVMIPSGNTLVMGGLIEDNVHTENVKVPVLGDIPGLGLLFRHDSKSRTKSNLIVFLTPTIVREDDYQPTKTEYLKTPVPKKDSVEDADWGPWDSGKPADWSKPKAK